MIIEGEVATGFESLRTLFSERMHRFYEKNVQLCVYVGDQRVVDLWASADDDLTFTPDAITNVFSSSKNLEAIGIAWLFDQGLISYDEPIATYWPEFAAHDKGTLTVAGMMRHEAGLTAFDQTLAKADLWPENIKQNSIGRVIEAQHLAFPKNGQSRREYHAITRGWIVNEVFRRLDPEARTLGEFVRAELSGPLQADTYLGLTDSEHARIAPISSPGVGYQLGQSLLPRSLGRSTDLNLLQSLQKLNHLRPMIGNRSRPRSPAPIEDMNMTEFWYDRATTRGEIPSANANSSARGLASLAAMLANQGQWQGQQIISPATWQAMHDQPVKANMGFVTTFTQGGVAKFEQPAQDAGYFERHLNEGREGFYGWMGAGGSIFQWHPELKIGFGYVPTSMNFFDFLNERGKAYQTEILKCLA
ncbi:MAG: serine hydrolase domain-containing protein [Pseudomonadales bacterium]